MSDYLAGRYQVLDRIGGGQQGSVYRARDTLLDRHVALKMIEGADVAFGQQDTLKREALLLAKFEHPNFVRVYDVVVDEQGHPVIVMELLEGEPLSNCIESLSEQEVLSFVKQICGAMDAAHQAGLIHRDLKPGNIIYLGRNTSHARFVILDMGIGKFIDAQGLGSGAGKETYAGGGTPLYMAPEQYNGESGDARTDIYAFGSILYEIYSRAAPFQHYGSNLGLMTKAAISELPASLLTRSPRLTLSPELDRLILSCLEKGPDQRPQSMSALAAGYVSAMERLDTVESSVFYPGGTIPPPGFAEREHQIDANKRSRRPTPGSDAEKAALSRGQVNRPARAAAVFGALATLLLVGVAVKQVLVLGNGSGPRHAAAEGANGTAAPRPKLPSERAATKTNAVVAQPYAPPDRTGDGPAASGPAPQVNAKTLPPQPEPAPTAAERLAAYLTEHGGALSKAAAAGTEFIINLPADGLNAVLASLVYDAAIESGAHYHVRLSGADSDVLSVAAEGEPRQLKLDLSTAGPRTESALDAFNVPDRLGMLVATYSIDFDDSRLESLLQRQSRLETIDLAGTGIGLRIPEIRDEKLGRLRRLNLSTGGVSGAYILNIARHSQLVELRVANTDFDGETAAGISYSQLQLLDATNTALQNEGVDTVCELGGATLERLILAGTAISDDAIESLVTLKKLQRLDVQGTMMTPMGIEKLRSQLPDAEILSD